MEVKAVYLDDSKFEVAARTHRAICGQPRDNGGADAGMSPPEFLMASLASCAAYYAAQYLKTRGLPASGLDDRHLAGMLRAVKICRRYRPAELRAPIGEQAREQLIEAYRRMLDARRARGA
ncbi:MAG: hypothetical protein EXQ52_11180 [Bryobacterales bacterium]|nr:hypothetical protein [Bryobacterales bacterium]